MKKLLILTPLLLALLIISSVKKVSAQVNCPSYCQGSPNPFDYCLDSGIYPGQGCVNSNYYCYSDPTKICWCCPQAIGTPTPIPSPTPTICEPSFHSCDATHPCCSLLEVCNGNCVTPTPTLPSSIPTCVPYKHDCDSNHLCCGTDLCLAGHCYHATCSCGNSETECPDFWTCQNVNLPASACGINGPPQDTGICKQDYLNCTGGAAGIDCMSNDQCIRECGTNNALCEQQPGYWRCNIGAPSSCIGISTGASGECYFLTCPPNLFWDGINIPTNVPLPTNLPIPSGFRNFTCPNVGYSCCVFQAVTTIPRPALDVGCIRNGEPGINTAIGCIPVTSQTSLLTFILPWALGVGGGTAFVLIIVSGFLLMTSRGDPQRIRAAKELLTSAIIGLLLIIFSVYVLDVVGLRILRIPGL